jgi:hypothetical protein
MTAPYSGYLHICTYMIHDNLVNIREGRSTYTYDIYIYIETNKYDLLWHSSEGKVIQISSALFSAPAPQLAWQSEAGS